MERVTGIGGVFFRASDAERLRAWYAEHLGIELEAFGGAVFRAASGDATVWAAFEEATEYFGSAKQWMLNYRVSDLDRMLTQLRDAGVPVDDRIEEDENGRFGWATDPEGNRFELWEPPGARA